MRTIWKFDIELTDKPTRHEVPAGGVVRFVGKQNGNVMPSIWIEVETNNPPTDRCFVVYGTGREITQGDVYLGTYLDYPFVWHVFEIMK